MKPRDQWTVGDVITGRHHLRRNIRLYFVLLAPLAKSQSLYETKALGVGPRIFRPKANEPVVRLKEERYHSTLTEPQMALLHLEAYEALHAQLQDQFFP